MQGHKLTLAAMWTWVLLETLPSFVSPFLGDETYSYLYFLTEDLASVSLALALYGVISYSAIHVKALSLLVLFVSSLFAATNLFIDPDYGAWQTAFVVSLAAVSTILTLFFKLNSVHIDKPSPNRIYLVYTKPHSFWGLILLLVCGASGLSIYQNKNVWKFSKPDKHLIKTFNPEHCIGKTIVDCGPATDVKMKSLDDLIGTKWTIRNNCITIFIKWKRRWGNGYI